MSWSPGRAPGRTATARGSSPAATPPAGRPQGGGSLSKKPPAGARRSASLTIGALGKAVVAGSGNGPGDAGGVFFQRFDLPREAMEGVELSESPPAPAGSAAPAATPVS